MNVQKTFYLDRNIWREFVMLIEPQGGILHDCMKPTKSCLLTLEAIVFASWITLEGSEVISAALRPNRAIVRFVCALLTNISSQLIQQTVYRNVFLQRILDSVSVCTLCSQCQCHECVCAEPACAGCPHWDTEIRVGTAQGSVWQTGWRPTDIKKTTTKRTYFSL